MKIVIVGYGKMGKTIARLAIQAGHEVVGKIDLNTSQEEKSEAYAKGDVAIEFSHPDGAYDNIVELIGAGLPVVSGTTGWLSQYDQLKAMITSAQGSFLYASNFSVGVNIMMAINEQLAKIMNRYNGYNVSVEEVHHVHKKDAPSGTALSLVEDILHHIERKEKWSLESTADDTVTINAMREGEVFGDHRIKYHSSEDTIELVHSAHTRDGFAKGAILAAQWLTNSGHPRVGLFHMKDMMHLRD